MTQLFKNNATSVLANAASNVATSLVLAAGQGARFPTLAGSDYFYLTLIGRDSNGIENAWEIVKVTARVSDTLTVVRAQDGTTGVAWGVGTAVSARLTAATMNNLAPRDEQDATGGYVGLTLFKINFKNALNTFTSFFTNANTAARTYTFQNRNGIIADDSDLILKAPLASPTFTGTVAGISKTMVGLGNVDNTSDVNKPVSTAMQDALDSLSSDIGLKEDAADKDATGGYAGLTLFKINFKNAANTFTSFFTNANTAARTYTFQNRNGIIADDSDLILKAPLASPAFTGTTTGITKTMVGLGNVDNTTDALKPVSTATQSALNSKADLAGNSAQAFNVASLNGGQLAGLRNRIINGDFRFDQRNSGVQVNATDGVYHVDRWRSTGTSVGGVRKVQQLTDAPLDFGFSVCGSQTGGAVTGLGADYAERQYLELDTVRDMAGETINLSFWYKSSRTGPHCARLIGSVAPATVGGVDDINTFTVNVANTWEYKTISSDALLGVTSWGSTTGNAAALAVDIGFRSGSTGAAAVALNDNYRFTGVQLEIGGDTPFEHRPFGLELSLCQRYFETSTVQNALGGVYAVSGTGFAAVAPTAYKATKRTTPTIAFPTYSAFVLASVSYAGNVYPAVDMFGVVFTTSSPVGTFGTISFTATSSAEL